MPLPQHAELCSLRGSSPGGAFPPLALMRSFEALKRDAENMTDYRHCFTRADV
jgi:hypothetical protein